jgi:hypothetical protein
MSRQTYIGIIETIEDGNLVVSIGFSQSPEIFEGRCYPITSETGEGSCKDLVLKLMREYQDAK